MAWLMDTYSQHVGHSVPAVVTGSHPPLGAAWPGGRRQAGLMFLLPQAAGSGDRPEQCLGAIHGFGNVGRYAAIAGHQMGVKVAAVSDISGALYDPDGLDVDAVAKWVDENRFLEGFRMPTSSTVTRSSHSSRRPGAGRDPERHPWRQRREIQAKIIIEGANGPTTLEADDILREEDVLIIPDILANAGGVTVSYFEWVQDVQKYFWTENEVVARLREIMTRAFSDVHNIAINEDVDLRTAALIKGIRKVADAKLVRGSSLKRWPRR